MSNLFLESTPKTPEVNFDTEKGTFDMKGMSCAEYALEFYLPIFEWLDKYAEDPKPKTQVNFQLKYFNTSSAKCLLQLLEKFAAIRKKEFEVEVNWHFIKNDEQMIQDGENYSEILDLPFNMVEMKTSEKG